MIKFIYLIYYLFILSLSSISDSKQHNNHFLKQAGSGTPPLIVHPPLCKIATAG